MAYLIGTDEAGYGPNLGPLVISGSLWRIPDVDFDLQSPFADAVGTGDKQIQIDDSKSLYQSTDRSIARLEKSALVLLQQTGAEPRNVPELIQALSVHANAWDDQPYWNPPSEKHIPVESDPQLLTAAAIHLAHAMSDQSVQLLKLSSDIIIPKKFNRLVDELGNKATVLSVKSLELVAKLVAETDDDLIIICDKHGGRSKYSHLLYECLTDRFVEVKRETLAESRYLIRESNRSITLRFLAKGERFFPVAVASIVSKYLRELSMRGWNEFWQAKVPDLKPTAGYPTDAIRFKNDIQAAQDKLGIADDEIWRCR